MPAPIIAKREREGQRGREKERERESFYLAPSLAPSLSLSLSLMCMWPLITRVRMEALSPPPSLCAYVHACMCASASLRVSAHQVEPCAQLRSQGAMGRRSKAVRQSIEPFYSTFLFYLSAVPSSGRAELETDTNRLELELNLTIRCSGSESVQRRRCRFASTMWSSTA